MFFKKATTPTNNNSLSDVKTYNILFIGGSNTVMKEGYVSQLTDLMRNGAFFMVDKVDNIAVGASSCTLALERLLNMSNLNEYDIFFIEYTINDSAIYVKDGGDITWRLSYEGLIRMILQQNPKAIIVPLIFGRLYSRHVPPQEAMRQFILQLQPLYNLCVIDSDAMLRGVQGKAGQFRKQYEDVEHYAYPYTTNLIAHHIYLNLLQYLHNHPEHNFTKLPNPLEKYCFDNIATFDLTTDYKNKAKYEITNFTNSRYNLNAITIPVGESITIELTSPIISLSFISAANSCSLLIDSDGEATVIDTLHRKVHDGDFKFLYKNFTFTDSRWRQDFFKTPRTITLKAIDSDERTALEKHHKDAFNMMANQASEKTELKIYLCRVVYVR
jgi:hypothetical protein